MSAALSWTRSLRSAGLCADLLTEHHGFSRSASIREAAKEIAAHAEVAVALLEQALSGPPHVSYLSAYYGLLDLAKIVVIASGALARLQMEKRHGMSWSGIQTASQDLRTDHITLHSGGAGALFYRALTGSSWVTQSRSKRVISMRDVYPYIPCISFEYMHIYRERRLASLTSEVERTGEGVGRVRVSFNSEPSPAVMGRGPFKILVGLKKEGDASYVSDLMSCASEQELTARAGCTLARRYLLYCNRCTDPTYAAAESRGLVRV